MSARAALRVPTMGGAGVSLCAERCGFVSVDGHAREYGQALNALKNLCLVWRYVPSESVDALKASIGALLQALEQWPDHLRASVADLKPKARARREKTASDFYPGGRPHWID